MIRLIYRLITKLNQWSNRRTSLALERKRQQESQWSETWRQIEEDRKWQNQQMQRFTGPTRSSE